MTDKISAWMNKPLPVIRSKKLELNIAPGVYFVLAFLVAVTFLTPTK